MRYCHLYDAMPQSAIITTIMFYNTRATEENGLAAILAEEPTPKGPVVMLQLRQGTNGVQLRGFTDPEAITMLRELQDLKESTKKVEKNQNLGLTSRKRFGIIVKHSSRGGRGAIERNGIGMRFPGIAKDLEN